MQAQLEQRKSGNALAIAAVVGTALYAYSKSRKGSPGGDEPPPGGIGQAQIAGGIGAVAVHQRTLMGSHLLPKEFGAPISVSVPVAGGTLDAAGTPIPWPMQLVIRIGHNTTFGWRQPRDLNASWPLGHAVRPTTQSGSFTSNAEFETPPDPDQEWDIRAWLFALESDPTGVPIGRTTDFITPDIDLGGGVQTVEINGTRWVGLDYKDHPSAIQSIEPDISAQVGGSITGSITVAQRLGLLRRRHSARSRSSRSGRMNNWGIHVEQTRMGNFVSRHVTASGVVTNNGDLSSTYRVRLFGTLGSKIQLDSDTIGPLSPGQSANVTLSGSRNYEDGENETFVVELDRTDPSPESRIDSFSRSYTENHTHTAAGALQSWSASVSQRPVTNRLMRHGR